MHGIFENNSPKIDFEIWGVNKKNSTKLTGIIDTGFNGYLTMPLDKAFPLGLVLAGVQSSTLADDSVSHSLVCTGTVKLCGVEIPSPISIAPASSILIGTQLMERTGKDLFINFVDEKVEFRDKSRRQPSKS